MTADDHMAAQALADAAFHLGMMTTYAMLRNRTMLDDPSREALALAETLRRAGYPVLADVLAAMPAKARSTVAAPGDTIDADVVDAPARELPPGT